MTEGLWGGGGGAGIKKVSIKTATVLLSFPHGSPCVTRRLGRGEKRSMQGMIHVRGDGGRRTTPFALPIIPSCLLFLFNLLGRIVSMNCLLEPLLRR